MNQPEQIVRISSSSYTGELLLVEEHPDGNGSEPQGPRLYRYQGLVLQEDDVVPVERLDGISAEWELWLRQSAQGIWRRKQILIKEATDAGMAPDTFVAILLGNLIFPGGARTGGGWVVALVDYPTRLAIARAERKEYDDTSTRDEIPLWERGAAREPSLSGDH